MTFQTLYITKSRVDNLEIYLNHIQIGINLINGFFVITEILNKRS